MKRKIIQIGNSTQLISLPREWCKANNIKKHDELEIKEDGHRVIIAKEETSQSKDIEIDITDLDRSSIMFLIRALYRRGYDTITLHFKRQVTAHYRTLQQVSIINVIHTEVNRLTGLEILQQKENTVVLRSISEMSIKEFDNVLRRVFLLLLDANKDIITATKTHDLALAATIEEKHDTISKLISYCLRLLNTKGYSDTAKIPFYHHLLASLDTVTDYLKYSGRSIFSYKKKLKSQTIKVIEEINSSLIKYYDCFYKFNFNNVREWSAHKEHIKKLIYSLAKKIPEDEFFIISTLGQTVEILRDILETRMALEY